MNREKQTINQILAQFVKVKGNLNEYFESDAEVIEVNGSHVLFTTDEFSGEDFLRDDDPNILGWNLAVCTISDILASGGIPLYYANSMQIPEGWTNKYIKALASGIAASLKASGASFIGGDLGIADKWSYTGICLGKPVNQVSRKGVAAGDEIFLTGPVGAGNMEASLEIYKDKKVVQELRKKYRTIFRLRNNESKLIGNYATSCIDTSDGLINALNAIAEINNTGYRVSDIPLLKEGVKICKALSMPPKLLLMGECGEYELLFTVNRKNKNCFLKEAIEQNMKVFPIGEITSNPGRILVENGQEFKFNEFDISARSFKDVKDYVNELIKYISK